MRNLKFISLTFGVLLLASCSEDIYDEPVQEDYSKNFIDQFGTINPNQDWNVAEVKSVTVNPGSASEVKIYAKNGVAYNLVGHYKDVSGQQTLKFDAAETCDEFVVVAGGKGKLVSNGGNVDFTSVGSRTYHDSDWGSSVFEADVDDEGKPKYTEFTWDEVMSFAQRLPEEENNTDPDKTGVSNVTNFKVISQGDRIVKVYPVFWNADYEHTLGVYWDANGNGRIDVNERHDIYTDKEGDDVQVYVKRTEDTHNNPDTYEGYESVTWDHFEQPSDVTTTTGWGPFQDRITYTGEIDKSQPIRSRGFTVTIPDGVEYGFYVKVYDGGDYRDCYYSAADDNDGDKQAVFLRTRVDGGNSATGNYRTFLGFEDQTSSEVEDPQKEPDLNDFMLILDPSPLVVDEDAESWTIACEDLGSTDDYDFNDVVFSVTHVAGSTEATVQPLAAGGTLETYITWADPRDPSQEKKRVNKEIHEWIGLNGQTAPDGFAYPMLNTQGEGTAGEPYTITVDPDFHIGITPDADNMGGFAVEVVTKEGKLRNVDNPGLGEAPQMICVTGNWKWPYEKMNIKEAYPEFGPWGENYQHNEWYNYPAAGKTLGNK